MYPKNTELIVGLMGKKDHGKTVVAEYLMERHDFGSVAFADPLKRKLSELLDIPLEKFYPTTEEGKIYRETGIIPGPNMTIRQLMQVYGDGCRTMLYNEIWINLVDKMLRASFLGNRLVFSDVRYINEADYVRNQGGYIIRIIDSRKDSGDYHISETEQGMIKQPYFMIMNDRTLKDLFIRVDEVLNLIEKLQEKA